MTTKIERDPKNIPRIDHYGTNIINDIIFIFYTPVAYASWNVVNETIMITVRNIIHEKMLKLPRFTSKCNVKTNNLYIVVRSPVRLDGAILVLY